MERDRGGWVTILLATSAIWGINFIWLSRDTRPPVWDMALHQTYALNYLPQDQDAPAGSLSWSDRSGNYPPFVHLAIATCFRVFHPGPHIAVLANIPATLLLFWALYMLSADLAGLGAARWACLLSALTPYLIWMSRETVLDYWLSAWVAAALVALRRAENFQSRRWSLLFGLVCALGMLTKWFFAAFLFFPLFYVCLKSRIWREPRRVIHLADALLITGALSGLWYLPNLPALVRYFPENMKIGALEGEPPAVSFQSFIYYLRLLEGYQLFAVLFVVVAVACVVVWRRRLLHDGAFLAAVLCGGWVIMTLLRTKDARFTMPLLALLSIIAGAWLSAWGRAWWVRTLQIALVAVLCMQAYAANFGVHWLPEKVVLVPGYRGSVRWDWNLYLQNFFEILGPPRREDWRLREIALKVSEDAHSRNVEPTLALVPDLPFFNSTTFTYYCRLLGLTMHADQLKADPVGVEAFAGYNYVVIAEGDQGIAWTTHRSRALNQIVVDNPQTFLLTGLYTIPGNNAARLYYIQRAQQ